MARYRVEVTIIEGHLVEGTFVRMAHIGYTKTGRVAFRSTSSGTYVGTQVDEGDLYHMFRGGEINGQPDAHHGSPVRDFVA